MAKYKVVNKKRQLQTPDPCHCYQNDHVDLVVEGAGIRLFRLSSLSVPAEVSAFIPRVEIRRRHYENGQLVCEDERIYNSITVVHAPRHPPENPPFAQFPAPLPPAAGSTPEPLSDDQLFVPQPTLPGQQPSAPAAPPGPEQPEAPAPPVIPSEPEPHPPPVSPLAGNLNLPKKSLRQTKRDHTPLVTINKRPIG
ncbi:hypothetical protein [Desulforamulus hydrothermalis]|uniref:Uncharacterized protein n=1 Tax=Desulforamulus hydrothermalis Lam5 = DSM 18033 TaxID=1121428 RepID=K8E118_9FIRM|nr:hypothetical protein [Desulforamulus hydrothermalis]CCO09320.1 conserved hypothetical protein [Desulforamulus hydrothermalis Lam5 = DSM 18033]SHH04213.1 hypothetical protein SAMN02745177_01217 [Desulforamulus hydrothermalis Lam5 = DSM 18033]